MIGLVLSLCAGLADDLPAPKGAFRELRFSPDGRYVLAQDDTEITVLTVQPFVILFRIPAEDADVAKFTPDSRQLVCVNRVTRPSRGPNFKIGSARRALEPRRPDPRRINRAQGAKSGNGGAVTRRALSGQ